MKKIIILLSLVISGSAFAAEPSLTCSQISTITNKYQRTAQLTDATNQQAAQLVQQIAQELQQTCQPQSQIQGQ